MAVAPWWVTPDGRRVSGRPNIAAIRDKELKQSQVLHVGKIVQDIMYGDSNTLSWMEEGKGRVLTLVWATAFFGGDTVPSVAGYTPKAGGAAMALMDERVGALIYETGMESSASLLRAAQQLLKAAVYSKHKTWFDVGVTRPASWVAETSLQDMADTVYEKCQDQPTNWMLSEDQIRVQSLKTNSRVREWATSWTAEPRIVFGPRDSLSGCWQRDPNQLKGLFAVDADGKVVGAAITRKNVAPEATTGSAGTSQRWLGACMATAMLQPPPFLRQRCSAMTTSGRRQGRRCSSYQWRAWI